MVEAYYNLAKDLMGDWIRLAFFITIFIEFYIAYAYVKRRNAKLSHDSVKDKEIDSIQNCHQDIGTPISPVRQTSNYGTYSNDDQKTDICPSNKYSKFHMLISLLRKVKSIISKNQPNANKTFGNIEI